MSAPRLVGLTLSLLVLLGFGGCASSSKDSGGEPMARDMTEGGEGNGANVPSDLPGKGRLGGVEERAGEWNDQTEGEVATLVYVTEMRGKRGNQPGAMIFGSDPYNAHFRRKPTPIFVVRRLYKSEMKWLQEDLRKLGFFELPWQSETNYDAKIGPARAFHLYTGGQRRFVIKDELVGAAKRNFRRVEDRLLQLTFLR